MPALLRLRPERMLYLRAGLGLHPIDLWPQRRFDFCIAYPIATGGMVQRSRSVLPIDFAGNVDRFRGIVNMHATVQVVWPNGEGMSGSQFDCYASWGFKENPFQPSPLHPNARGKRLLVGRDNELGLVKTRLHKHGKITCVEGQVGIGKTSLVNIAAYQCLQSYLTDGESQLLIPCNEAFQLSAKENVDEFCTRVFLQVAQTLLDQASLIKSQDLNLEDQKTLDAWLNSPQITHVEYGLKSFSEISRTTHVNDSTGFNAAGFERLIRAWLHEIFPAHGSGGVVCIIDNLELLETANKAKKLLESLRDRLFNTEGLRWVFCGANGIVSSAAASPRLSGYLTRPVLEVTSLAGDKIPELLGRRIAEFSSQPGKEYLPLTADDLQKLYWIINFNLRDLLAHADDYCMYIFEHRLLPQEDDDRHKRFETWLKKQTVEEYQSLSQRISRDAWELLDTAMSEELRGTFGPGDFNFFKKNSFRTIEYKTFLTYMRKFEDLGVISRSQNSQEEEEKKRVIFSVTSKGALVHYARFIRDETRTMAALWLRRSSRLKG